MQTIVTLLRGINVGGKNLLPMAQLVEICASVGLSNIQTYIQSGNVIAQTKDPASKVGAKLAAAIKEKVGFQPHILVLTADEFLTAAKANPYKSLVSAEEGKAVHLMFLDAEPDKQCAAKLDALKAGDEAWQIIGKTFYLYVPDNFHKSKLAARSEKALGVNATGRNWRTICKIVEMLGA